VDSVRFYKVLKGLCVVEAWVSGGRWWGERMVLGREAYGRSVHVKTWSNPQERTFVSDSLCNCGMVVMWSCG
jgi:hypothetical protein